MGRLRLQARLVRRSRPFRRRVGSRLQSAALQPLSTRPTLQKVSGMTLTVTTITNRDQWNAALRALPYAHVLQTWEWGEFKRVTTGWQPYRLAFSRDNQIVALASV